VSRRNLGIGMVALGALLLVAGFATLGGADDEPATATPATTTTAAPADTTTTAAAPADTTTTTATTSTTTSTTTTTTTTTTTLPPPSIDDFILNYAAATDSGDGDFLFSTLLPQLRDAFGADLCRTWVDREILALSNYEQTGEVTGPIVRTLAVNEVEIEVDNYYEAPVRFTFQGQSFDQTATFVVADGQVYWIGACR